MRFDKLLIGILVFCLILTFSMLFWQDSINEYGLNYNTTDFEEVYNTSNDMYNIAEDMKNKTLDADTEGSDQSWESLVKGGYSAIRLVGGSFGLIGDIANSLSRTIGIPEYFIDYGMIILLISVVAGIIFMVFRFKEN